MNTMAPAKPVSQSSAPRSRSTERNRRGAWMAGAWECWKVALVIASARPPGSGGPGFWLWIPACAGMSGVELVRILGLQQRERRHRQDVEVEQQRPVLDVVEIVLDARLDLLLAVGLAAPAVDLCPAGDAGLQPMTRARP